MEAARTIPPSDGSDVLVDADDHEGLRRLSEAARRAFGRATGGGTT